MHKATRAGAFRRRPRLAAAPVLTLPRHVTNQVCSWAGTGELGLRTVRRMPRAALRSMSAWAPLQWRCSGCAKRPQLEQRRGGRSSEFRTSTACPREPHSSPTTDRSTTTALQDSLSSQLAWPWWRMLQAMTLRAGSPDSAQLLRRTNALSQHTRRVPGAAVWGCRPARVIRAFQAGVRCGRGRDVIGAVDVESAHSRVRAHAARPKSIQEVRRTMNEDSLC